MSDPDLDKLANALSKRFMDEGKIIAAGWAAFRHILIPPEASEIQVREMELAFYAGAQHLWASMMTGLDEDAEPTEDDQNRMAAIDAELAAFGKELEEQLQVKSHQNPSKQRGLP